MGNQMDTMDYMGDWMDRVFELELETMFADEPFTEEEKAAREQFEKEFFGEA